MPANRLLYGDNLAILSDLRNDPLVNGRVALVYVDPPFATDQEFRFGQAHVSRPKGGKVAYSDRLTGKAYLDALRERLLLLRDLLSPGGSIYVHIDAKMQHRVRLLMDDVFGERRFVSQVIRVKCNPKNFDRAAFGNVWDTLLFYRKEGGDPIWNGSRQDYTREQLRRLFPRVDKKGRRYTTVPVHAPGETADGPTGGAWRGRPPPTGRHWRSPPEELDLLDREGLIEWSKRGNPRRILYADEQRKKQTKRQDLWTFKDPVRPKYPTEKNLRMLEVIVQASSRPGDIILDAYCGSGTTLVAAERLDRRWIGIDSSKTAIAVAKERLGLT